jgi:hypothetical protein
MYDIARVGQVRSRTAIAIVAGGPGAREISSRLPHELCQPSTAALDGSIA